MPKAQVNGATIAYEAHGEGEPLLLIHGAGVSRIEFRPQHEALSKQFRLIIPDVRGHGDSEITRAPYSMKLFADDMIGLLDVLGIPKVMVCGHSMGGTIGQQMAVDYPTRVQALILAETNYGLKSDPLLRAAGVIGDWMVGLIGIKRLIPMTARQLAAGSKEAEAMYLEAFAPQQANPANFMNISQANNNFDGKGQLHLIQCPTLVMIAERNRATHGMGRYMAKTIPGAQLMTIPKAGHGLNWDNTEAFNAAVLEFFIKVTYGS
ncbi:MAG: alpha/beta hydrolase [Anaerolineae bacterium]|nr:alpha/beta hydrolase [Anaerolineae bacterium]